MLAAPGLSFSWTSLCCARLLCHGKSLPHTSHGRFLSWTRLVCFLHPTAELKPRPQYTQAWVLAEVALAFDFPSCGGTGVPTWGAACVEMAGRSFWSWSSVAVRTAVGSAASSSELLALWTVGVDHPSSSSQPRTPCTVDGGGGGVTSPKPSGRNVWVQTRVIILSFVHCEQLVEHTHPRCAQRAASRFVPEMVGRAATQLHLKKGTEFKTWMGHPMNPLEDIFDLGNKFRPELSLSHKFVHCEQLSTLTQAVSRGWRQDSFRRWRDGQRHICTCTRELSLRLEWVTFPFVHSKWSSEFTFMTGWISSGFPSSRGSAGCPGGRSVCWFIKIWKRKWYRRMLNQFPFVHSECLFAWACEGTFVR